jgi:hypothetical protein
VGVLVQCLKHSPYCSRWLIDGYRDLTCLVPNFLHPKSGDVFDPDKQVYSRRQIRKLSAVEDKK